MRSQASAADCCASCRSTQNCNIWVYCGEEGGCGSRPKVRPRLGARASHLNANELLHSNVQTAPDDCTLHNRLLFAWHPVQWVPGSSSTTYPRPFSHLGYRLTAYTTCIAAPCLCHATRRHVRHAVAQSECWLKNNKLSYVMDMRGKGHSGISWTAGAVYSPEEYATYERGHAAALKVQPDVHRTCRPA